MAEILAYHLQRFIPRNFHQPAIPAYHGCLQAGQAMHHVYHPKASPDTELAGVGGAIVVTYRADEFIVLHLDVHTAAHRAIGAHAGHDSRRDAFPLGAPVGQGADRAGVHTRSTELAAHFQV